MSIKSAAVVIWILGLTIVGCTPTDEGSDATPTVTSEPTATTQPSPRPMTTVRPPTLPTAIVPEIPDNPVLANQLQLVDANRMINTINTLIGFENRHTLSEPSATRGIFAARDFLLSELYGLAAQNPDVRVDVYPHEFEFVYNTQAILAENVIMVLNGTDAEAGVVLISAHYDTVGLPNIADADSYQPGANDNGSGVAAVLEIARLMAPHQHRATVVFAFFTGEELDRYGSTAYLEQFIIPYEIDLRAVINLDIIGSPTGPDDVRYDHEMRVFADPTDGSASARLAQQIAFIDQLYLPDISVNLQTTLDRPGRWSDHQTFSAAGFAAVRLTEQADEPLLTHNALDNIDEIDGEYLRRTTQVALATLLVLADGPGPPTDIRIDPATWRIEWQPSRGAQRYLLAFRSAMSSQYTGQFAVDVTNLTWPDLRHYEAVAIAAIDSAGRIGPLSAEILIR